MTTEETTQRKRRGMFGAFTLKRHASGEKRYSAVKTELKPPSMMQVSSTNPYNFPFARHTIAHFHRDEIVTGATLRLTETPNFQFYNVCGIDAREHADATDVMTDNSISDNHEEEHGEQAFHHRQFPEAPNLVVDEEERARAIIQAQTETATGKVAKSNKPLHKYMIKQLHSKCPNQEQAILHLAHETRLWKQLSHKHYNLLTLRGTASLGGETVFGSQWDSYFLLTDRISETLAQRIQRWRNPKKGWLQSTPIPKAQVDTTSREFRLKMVYAQNLASVLAFLHSKHIAVQNLSPESIGFLASDDTLQLMDLGQAVEVRSEETGERPPTSSETMLLLAQQHEHPLFQMTPGGQPYRYMAPELLTLNHFEEKLPTCESTAVDSYSWGMIAFELLTLHQPFAKMKLGQHLKQVALRTPSLRPHLEVYHLPKVVENLIKRAWRQEASLRLEAFQIDRRLKQFLEKELHSSK